MRLTGIIDYSMDNFLCVRGFASMLALADISMADTKIQRDLIEEHRGEMEAFLEGGEFTFFPEVILCANMRRTEVDEVKIDSLGESVRIGNNFRRTAINNIKYSTKVYSVKKENNNLAYDKIQTIIMEFDKNVIEKFLRIDGNHRLSAVNDDSSYASKPIPYCLLLFRTPEETDKFCRALFYNINTKQIPLKTEENLKVIIDSELVFLDDTLKNDPSFGWNYYLARKTLKNINLADFPFINNLIRENEYTYFVQIYDLLIHDHLISESEDAIPIITTKLTEINEALREATMREVPHNLAVIGTLSYYKVSHQHKFCQFLHWVKTNSIVEVKDLHMGDLINIYDKIYDNVPKTIFMSMWFDEKTKDTYQTVCDVRDTLKRENDIDLNIIRVDEHTDGFSDEIYSRITKAIEASSLVIADLSYGNKNVHHEVGYAQGLHKKVLMLYNVRDGIDSKKEIGSNISMHDQLRFTNQSELRPNLLRKIRQFFGVETD